MKLNDLINQNCEWLKGTGPNSNVVISSRIRLARNLSRISFSHWANKKQKEEVLKKAKEAFGSSNYTKGALFLQLADLNNLDKQFLIERHLISREHAMRSNHKAVLVGDREILSIMVNEEDHLRMQVMQSGFNLGEAWQITKRLDEDFEKSLQFAYSQTWGYLTACPTNTGTGLRASVMLHLPALVMARQINKVLQAITKLNLTARGFYGEGTEASGNFFQISNQVTLGHSEEDILDNIERVIKQVIGHEQNARRALFEQDRARIEDRIWRSFATLKNAHIITSKEAIDLFSKVRLGVDMGILKEGLDIQTINRIFILMQPAHLQKIEHKTLSAQERDMKRAELIRKELGGN
ncbi:MAG: protein arginine kinase [Candidatus Omnitrophota bacterium]|nr:MAG: protein arginine kinase [Candidatus Omnitrophota bacterium]